MAKVLIATDKPFAPVAVKGIKEIFDAAGYETIVLEKYGTQEAFAQAAADVDAIIVRSDKVDSDILSAAKNLKIVVRAGAGYDNLDLTGCSANGVVAMNTPGQNSNAVAELAFGMMVMVARGFYSGKAGTELKGKKIGIHAYGNVGQNVGRIAKGFGMEVYAYDPFMTDDQITNAGAIPVGSVEELYSTCQYVSIHTPATEKTKKSIGYDLVGKMPKGAVVVNTARKEVIDEEGLIALMKERQDIAYMTDIAPDSEEFNQFEGRYFATPKKMGAQTAEANINAGLAAARQIVDFLENGNCKYQLNK